MKKRKKRKKLFKVNQLALIVAIIVVLVVLSYEAYQNSNPVESSMTYTNFMEAVESGEVSHIVLVKTQDLFTATMKNGEEYAVVYPGNDTFKVDLLESGVEIQVARTTYSESLGNILKTIPMFVLVFFIVFYLSKTLVMGSSTMFKVLKPEEIVSFDDVAGMTESKEEVMFAVEQIKNSRQLASIGAVPTRGIILEGPPGTGKTMLAKAIAGEADVPFISTSGSDFIEMFAGLGAARVRALWELAEVNAPCVLFIDEIDAVGRRRNSGSDGVAMESNQTLNALLQKMDGVGSNRGIFVVAATNRVSDLDPALLRPGRFDKQLFIGPPKSKEDRDAIVKVHLKGKRLDEGVTLDHISKLLFGMSGAEIAQVLNESVLISLQNGRQGVVNLNDVDEAAMKLRASGVVVNHSSEKDRRITAIHEAGHAVVSTALDRKVSKISIIPYSSGVGGITVEDTDDLEGKRIKQREDLLKDLRVLLGGKVAEEIVLGQSSTGSSNDLERASLIAYSYVVNYGMDNEYLINTDVISKANNIIVDNKRYIERANELLLEQQENVRAILNAHRNELDILVEKLLEVETVMDYNFDI